MTDWTSRSLPEDSFSFIINEDGEYITNEEGYVWVINTETHQTEWRPRETLT